MAEAITDLLRAHARELLYAGFWPLLLWGVTTFLLLVASLVLAWRRRWLRGVAGGLTVALLALLALAAAAFTGSAAAAPSWAEHAARTIGQHIERLGLVHDLGTALLVPAVQQYTRGGEDDEALFALEKPRGRIDLAPLTTPAGRVRVLGPGLSERIREHFDALAAPIVEAKLARLGPWTRSRALAVIDAELAAVARDYPRLLDSLRPSPSGALPPALAIEQVTGRFLAHEGPAHARMLAGAFFPGGRLAAPGVWLALYALCVLIGILSRRSPADTRRTDLQWRARPHGGPPSE